uniref:Uncharacterized protein n=1 Tax=Anguilla anguilla TaxID=7936 RepID=A0A0E9VG83_ANGAN
MAKKKLCTCHSSHCTPVRRLNVQRVKMGFQRFRNRQVSQPNFYD